jgi:DNA replication protein DnaD
MGNNQGWISVHRQIRDCELLWGDKPFSRGQAWIDLLLLANHEDKRMIFDGSVIEVKRGQRVTSYRTLCEAWGWSNTKVANFLEMLEAEQMIEKQSDTKKTLITIVNYDKFQDLMKEKRQQSDTETTPKRRNNNDNNENNINKKEGGKPQRVFIPPTIEEVSEYCESRKTNVDPQAFIDFYSSKGWMIGKNKMKDWKAAVRTWERRGTKSSKIEIDNKFRDFLEQNQVVDFGM